MEYNGIKFKWRHVNRTEPKSTTCIILHGLTILSTGEAHLAKGDNFCKEKGRKISLARALKISDFSKEEKREIWEQYRTMGNKNRW